MKKTLACLLTVLLLFASFPASAESGFQDVPSDAWYAQAVSHVYEKGWMHGVGNGKFAPGSTVTRGMVVTVLSRFTGIDAALYENSSFEDVPAGAYDSASIRWAAVHGIVNGVTDTAFAPKLEIRREDAALILFRYAQKSGNNTDFSENALQKISDAGSVSSYALQACKWAADKSILQGSDGRLTPRGNMTRAQLAQLLYNASKLLTAKDFTADYYLTALPKSEGKLTVNVMNHLLLFYNDHDLRTEIYNNINIDSFLNNRDLRVSDTARFAQSLLSGNSPNPDISVLSDGSRLFALFNDYYDYGSGNILYRIEGTQMDPFFTLPEPMTYICEQALSSDQNYMLVKACSKKSETLFLLDTQTKGEAQDLVGLLLQAIADDGLYANSIGENNETYVSIENAEWLDGSHIAFTASVPSKDQSVIMKVTASYDLSTQAITYDMLSSEPD